MVMSRRSVNLTTLFLGRLDLLSGKPVLSAHPFASNCTALLEPGLSNEDARLVTIGHFKKRCFTNCDEMLNFVDFINGVTCLHWRIMDVMLVFKLILLVIKMTAISAYLWMSTKTGALLLVLKKIEEK